MSAVAIYTLISILVAACDLAVAWCARKGRYLKICSLLSAAVCITYLVSILTENRMLSSVMCSLYFIAIDWMLLFLLLFVAIFTDRRQRVWDRRVHLGLTIFASLETISFLANPFTGHVVEYIPRDTVLAHFDWQMQPLYYIHLGFTYLMVAFALAMLVEKSLRSPRQYRSQYVNSVYVIAIIVLVNALFLYMPGDSILSCLDVSVCGYSAALFTLYWGGYRYSTKDMLEGLSMSVFDNIDQALVLFDYDGRLLMQNRKTCQLLQAEPLPMHMPMQDFIEKFCPSMSSAPLGSTYILQCESQVGDEKHTLRCDFSRIRDKRGMVIASLFVFTDARLETDLLTGFHAWDNFCVRLQGETPWLTPPTTIAIFDINNLSVINHSFGRDEGDRRLRALADCIREYMPAGSYFARGTDANLFAMIHEQNEPKMLAAAEKVREKMQDSVQFSIASIDSENGTVMDTVHDAEAGLKLKKLMDKDSSQSQILTTLVRALQQTDADTEAHVQRTRRMGAALGKRLGLSDVQMGQLSLLCLLHDIGKIGIPLEILNKPGKLSDEEWSVLQTHVEKGSEIAGSSTNLRGISDMILHHHERWDGKGYPSGLESDSIPLLSRVIAVVDAYDAMVNDRSYRPAMPRAKAIAELRRCAGTQFDPTVVAEFLAVLAEQPDIDGVKEDPVVQDISDDSALTVPQGAQFDDRPEDMCAVHPVSFSHYILDENSRIVRVDDAFSEITGYTADDIVARPLMQWDLLPPEECDNYQRAVSEQLARSEFAYFEHPLVHKDGIVTFVFCCGRKYYDSAVRSNRSEIIIADSSQTWSVQTLLNRPNDRDIRTTLHRWEEMYRRESLTGLLTYEAYRADVERYLLDGDMRVMLLVMDLDSFKQYNESFGQSAGDELLVLTAGTLSASMRKNDIACRLGSDTFSAALLFPWDQPVDSVRRRAEEIFTEIGTALQSMPGTDGLSMGAAIADAPNSETFRVLYQKADLALYDSKRVNGSSLNFYALPASTGNKEGDI